MEDHEWALLGMPDRKTNNTLGTWGKKKLPSKKGSTFDRGKRGSFWCKREGQKRRFGESWWVPLNSGKKKRPGEVAI